MSTVLEQSRTDSPTLELFGATSPRIATARPRGRSMGGAVIRFARDVLDLELLPWQQWCLRAGLVRDASGVWRSRTVAILVARQNGKTRLATVRALAGMVLLGERRIIAAAQNRDVALDAWNDALELALEAGLDVHSVCRTNGREAFWIGGARYKVVSATRRGGRGLAADLVILDELREYRDFAAWAALEKTRRARPSSQLWTISNEGDEGSVVLTALAEQGRAAAESRAVTDSAWMEYSAPDGLERDDPRAWVASNPALGYLIPTATVASEAVHDDPLVFDTEVLCRRVATLRPWIAVELWAAAADPAATLADGTDVVFAIDEGPEHRHASITVAGARPDGRVHVEAVAAYVDDEGPPLARAAERLADLVDRWHPRAVACVARSSGEAAAVRIVDGLEGDERPTVVALSSTDLVRATNAFREAVVARTLVHPPDAMTDEHVGAVTSDGILRRRSPLADIDAAVALVCARHAYVTAPRVEVEPSQIW